jgi:ATP-binding protein involved in chromosome partitioning
MFLASLTETHVLEILKTVDSGTAGLDIVARGWVKNVHIKDGHVTFALEVPASMGPKLEPVRAAAEAAVESLAGVSSVTAVLTAETRRPPPAQTGAPEPRARPSRARANAWPCPRSNTSSPSPRAKAASASPRRR